MLFCMKMCNSLPTHEHPPLTHTHTYTHTTTTQILLLSCQRLLTEHDAGTDVNPGNSSVLLKGLALISLFAAALVPADDRLQARLSPCSITPSPHIYDTHPVLIAVNNTTHQLPGATVGANVRQPLNTDVAGNEGKKVPGSKSVL